MLLGENLTFWFGEKEQHNESTLSKCFMNINITQRTLISNPKTQKTP